MKPSIGIAEVDLEKSIRILTILLADEFMLYTKIRKFHWNVCGGSYMEMHTLFQKLYREMEITMDEVAERINKLGSKAIGTMQEFLALTRLKESAGKYPPPQWMVKELLFDNEKLIAAIRLDIVDCQRDNKDAGTIDFLTFILKYHETNAWVLRRYLDD